MRFLGIKGEDAAVRYLRKKGYEIVRRNLRTAAGEIDIIAKERETLVFVEVKWRSGDGFGKPFEAVDGRKRERIRSAALLYLSRLRIEPAVRFDVLSISMTEGKEEIEHITDAF